MRTPGAPDILFGSGVALELLYGLYCKMVLYLDTEGPGTANAPVAGQTVWRRT